jgi:hypothetical protein
MLALQSHSLGLQFGQIGNTPERAMKTLSLKVPDGLAARLGAVARKRRTSKSVLVREALEAYLVRGVSAQPGSFLDLAQDLAGCLDGGPGDLAHNKKHLEGYGR